MHEPWLKSNNATKVLTRLYLNQAPQTKLSFISQNCLIVWNGILISLFLMNCTHWESPPPTHTHNHHSLPVLLYNFRRASLKRDRCSPDVRSSNIWYWKFFFCVCVFFFQTFFFSLIPVNLRLSRSFGPRAVERKKTFLPSAVWLRGRRERDGFQRQIVSRKTRAAAAATALRRRRNVT